MTNGDIEQKAAALVLDLWDTGRTDKDAIQTVSAAIWAAVSQAYEEAAQIADQMCKEADEFAEQECLPPDHGGNPEIAQRIRALKDLLSETVSA